MNEASLLIDEHPHIDEDAWNEHDRIDAMGGPVFDALYPPKDERKEQKSKFLDGDKLTSPDLSPTKVDTEALAAAGYELLELKKDLIGSNLPPEVKKAYRWRINEDLAGIRMVAAAQMGDMRSFNAYNKFIYGEPDPDVFAACVDWFRSEAESHTDNVSQDIKQAAAEVLHVLPDVGGNQGVLVPSEEVFEQVKQSHFKEKGYYALLLAGVELPDTKEKITREQGDPVLAKLLENLEAKYDIADSVASTWSVDHRNAKVKRPAKYALTEERFLGLPVGHEIGAHLLERQNGLRQPLKLFGSGLDRYESGNEGRGLVREQIPYESFNDFAQTARWQDVMRRHLTVSLAMGLLDGHKKNFAEAFNILNKVDYLWALRQGGVNDPEAAKAKSESRTWGTLERVYRGTNGSGGAYLKEKVYLEGNIACWKAAESNPEIIEWGDLGKFDITNPRHIDLAQAMGVLPEES